MISTVDMNDHKDYHFIHALDVELEELNDCVNEFWLKNTALRDQCLELLDVVRRHKANTNIAKSVGVGMGVSGALAFIGGLAMTPFTAGLSAVVTLGGGVATAAGAVTGLGTDAVDWFWTKRFFNRLAGLAEDRNQSAIKLSRKLTSFDVSLKERYGLNRAKDFFPTDGDNGLAFVRFVQMMSKSSVSVYKMGANALKLMEAVRDYRAISAAKGAKTVGSSARLVQSMSKSALNLLPTEANGLTAATATGLAVKGAVPTTGKLVLRGGTAALGLAFTVMDAVVLVSDWHKEHPTVDAINKFIDELESDHKLIQSVHTMISTAFGDNIIDDQLIEEILTAMDTQDCMDDQTSGLYTDNNGILCVDLTDSSVSYKNCDES